MTQGGDRVVDSEHWCTQWMGDSYPLRVVLTLFSDWLRYQGLYISVDA